MVAAARPDLRPRPLVRSGSGIISTGCVGSRGGPAGSVAAALTQPAIPRPGPLGEPHSAIERPRPGASPAVREPGPVSRTVRRPPGCPFRQTRSPIYVGCCKRNPLPSPPARVPERGPSPAAGPKLAGEILAGIAEKAVARAGTNLVAPLRDGCLRSQSRHTAQISAPRQSSVEARTRRDACLVQKYSADGHLPSGSTQSENCQAVAAVSLLSARQRPSSRCGGPVHWLNVSCSGSVWAHHPTE